MDERQPIQVGIDLRPIPLELKDGTVFHFNPDPPAQFFADVARIQSEGNNSDETDWSFVDRLSETLASQIVEPNEKAAFKKRQFGLPALNAIAKAYSEGVLGTPTQPPS